MAAAHAHADLAHALALADLRRPQHEFAPPKSPAGKLGARRDAEASDLFNRADAAISAGTPVGRHPDLGTLS